MAETETEATETDTHATRGDVAVALRPRLTVVCHPDPAMVGVGQAIAASGSIVLGRKSRFMPGVFDVRRVSREHARISVRGQGLELDDLGSHNGTTVNGRPVDQCRLDEGDVVGVGPILVLVHRGPVAFPEHDHPTLWGISHASAQLVGRLRSLAGQEEHTLLVGETGVGKEVVARALHAESRRRGEFVPVNCAGLADGVLASELFGHERGAFSGADTRRPGLVEAAAQGTLFLDEIVSSSPSLQAALLRLLDDKEYRPVGATRPRHADVRVVAALQPDRERPPESLIREDLWFRLTRRTLPIPPLRDRREDVPYLAQRFAEAQLGRLAPLGRRLAWALLRHRWPGNVRELRARVEQLVLAHPPGVDGPLELPPDADTSWVVETDPIPSISGPSPAGKKRARRPPRDELAALLEEHEGQVAVMARSMGVHRRTLYRWLDAYDLNPDAHRE